MALTTTPTCGSDFPDIIVKETDLESTAAIDVFDGAKAVHVININNSANGAVSYFKAYNAGSVTPASDVPVLKLAIPANSTRNVIIADGISFSTAFSMRCVSGTADDNEGNPSSSVIVVVVGS